MKGLIMSGTQKYTLRIERYSLWEFCQALEKSILAGYTLDLESNEGFPQQIGSIYTCAVVKEVKEEQEQEKEVKEEPKKVGRKPKSAE